MNLKDLRLKAQLSQAELASLIGCHSQQIYNFESGKAPIPMKRAKAYAKALNIKVRDFVEYLLAMHRQKVLKRMT